MPGSPTMRDAARRLPGDAGLWLFIAADTAAFGVFFLIFTAGRAEQPALYRESAQLLNAELGLLNTLLLLTSGWLMALAVKAARERDRPLLVRRLKQAILVASGFAASKAWEYTAKMEAGITLLTNEFFAYYYIFTGIHFLHYLVGVAVLLLTLSKARQQPLDAGLQSWTESAASYWHMVDLLWILLFPVVYLQR